MDIKRVTIPDWERKDRVIVKYLYYQVIFSQPHAELELQIQQGRN
ncbi:MAG: hypothetical protein PHG35_03505 [Dehalococcoidales bacterium]|nr:hypothetical protein [Dehalococcoidales bacterium]